MNFDLTTNHGRAQAYAESADTAAIVRLLESDMDEAESQELDEMRDRVADLECQLADAEAAEAPDAEIAKRLTNALESCRTAAEFRRQLTAMVDWLNDQ